MQAPPALLPIADAFAADPDVTLEPAMASICLKVKGKIFALINDGRLVLKLPTTVVDGLEASGKAERFVPGRGRVMKEWIALPPELQPLWLSLARQAHAFVAAGVKPKAGRG